MTFAVVRVGDGVAALSTDSTATSIDYFTTDGATVGSPINLSIAPNNIHPVTLSGTALSEGALSLSANGQYLTLAGYAVAPGTPSVKTTGVGYTVGKVNRVVARVDAAGNVDATTILDSAFGGNNVRAAASLDGSHFWVVGATSGVQYATLGVPGSLGINSTPANSRTIGIFGGQLYGCAASGAGGSNYYSVFTVGTGIPTGIGQTASVLMGLPNSTATQPYAFVFFDRDPAVTGVDTLYIADANTPSAGAAGGGIQKYTLANGSWSWQTTLKTVIDPTMPTMPPTDTNVSGLTGVVVGPNVTLIATTTEASANHVVVFVDDGLPSPVGTIVATAAMNTVYRGVALAPQ